MHHNDLDCVLAWRNHADVRRYMYTQHKIAATEHQQWFERTFQNPKKHLLVFESNHQPLGFVNFNESESGGIADWGFYTAPYARKGCGRQLGFLALNHAFTQLKIRKVCGQVIAHNERSVRFHLALGFKQEGVLRDQYFDGERYHNVISLGLLSAEWQPCL